MLDAPRHQQFLLEALAFDPLLVHTPLPQGDESLSTRSSKILPSTTRLMLTSYMVMRVLLGANPMYFCRSWVSLPMLRVTTLSPSAICFSMLKWRSEEAAACSAIARLSSSLWLLPCNLVAGYVVRSQKFFGYVKVTPVVDFFAKTADQSLVLLWR